MALFFHSLLDDFLCFTNFNLVQDLCFCLFYSVSEFINRYILFHFLLLHLLSIPSFLIHSIIYNRLINCTRFSIFIRIENLRYNVRSEYPAEFYVKSRIYVPVNVRKDSIVTERISHDVNGSYIEIVVERKCEETHRIVI